jgi:hypothetical protein
MTATVHIKIYRFVTMVYIPITILDIIHSPVFYLKLNSVPLESESRGTQDHVLFSQFLRIPQPPEPGPRIYIPQEQRGPVITLGAIPVFPISPHIVVLHGARRQPFLNY